MSEACSAYLAGKQGSQYRILAAQLALKASVQLDSAHPSFRPNSYLFHPCNWSNPLTFLLPWSHHFPSSAFGALTNTCDSLSWVLAAFFPVFNGDLFIHLFKEALGQLPHSLNNRIPIFSHYTIIVHLLTTCGLAPWHSFDYKVPQGSQKIVYILIQYPFECQTKRVDI